MVGTVSGDEVGKDGIAVLTNGNYVVRSSSLDNLGATNAGAVTWVNGSTCIPANESSPAAVVNSGNSLVGTTASDYVVRSSNWDNGAFINAGAVTWGNGTSGITVSSAQQTRWSGQG